MLGPGQGGPKLLAKAQTVGQDVNAGLDDRIIGTLRLFRDWGYAPTLSQLSQSLLGGQVDTETLLSRLDTLSEAVVNGEIIGLVRWENLIQKTRRRLRSNQRLSDRYLEIAQQFSRDLVSSCPFLRCVALTGSLATGGFADNDDIDFDLFVAPGTKYTTYLVATLIGLRFAWRHRHRRLSELHRTPLLPKITCVNVVWPDDQIRPFVRQDDALAFELMRCFPLYGVDHFCRMLADNRWIGAHFPQVFERPYRDLIASETNLLGRFLTSVGRRGWVLRAVETVSRAMGWIIYSVVQKARRRNPRAVARLEFLKKVKRPYEVFQD